MEIDFGKDFNWFDVLKNLSDGAEISERDKFRLDERAGSWPACACGQLCKLLPRQEDQTPTDWTLRDLGIRFSDAVSDEHWDRALTIFNKIEKRSTQLLRDMGIPVQLVEHKFKKIRKTIVEQKPFAVQLADHSLKRQTVLQK